MPCSSRTFRGGVLLGLLILAACSGGGGGSATTPPPATVAPPPPPKAITAPGAATLGANAPLVATGSTRTFALGGTTGDVLPLQQSTQHITATTVGDANLGGGTLTIVSGSRSSGNNSSPSFVLQLKVPSLSLDVTFSSISSTLKDGSALLIGGNLNYTMLGIWSSPALDSADRHSGTFVTGYQTPASAVPTAGSARYVGRGGPSNQVFIPIQGGALGTIAVPSGSGGVTTTFLRAGNSDVTVNFANGAVTGSLTGMTTVDMSLANPIVMPWNDVALSGTLSGAAVSGTTSTSGPPADAGSFGFSSASTGRFDGALYGPNATELGAVWSLYDPSGKAALGVLAGIKGQTPP